MPGAKVSRKRFPRGRSLTGVTTYAQVLFDASNAVLASPPPQSPQSFGEGEDVSRSTVIAGAGLPSSGTSDTCVCSDCISSSVLDVTRNFGRNTLGSGFS